MPVATEEQPNTSGRTREPPPARPTLLRAASPPPGRRSSIPDGRLTAARGPVSAKRVPSDRVETGPHPRRWICGRQYRPGPDTRTLTRTPAGWRDVDRAIAARNAQAASAPRGDVRR